MYDIIHYKDKNGKTPIEDFLSSIGRSNKDEFSKISRHIKMLEARGMNEMLNRGLVKKIHGTPDLFELRSGKIRIFFIHLDNSYVLLHGFLKKTNGTPRSEIDKAMKRRDDCLGNPGREREGNYERFFEFR